MEQDKNTTRDGPAPRREKGLWLMLAGIAVTGAVAWWRWLRSVPKER